MKTEDMIQIGALAVIGFLAYRKFGPQTKAPPPPSTSTLPVTLPVDFGVASPDDSTWGDASHGITFVDQILSAAEGL